MKEFCKRGHSRIGNVTARGICKSCNLLFQHQWNAGSGAKAARRRYQHSFTSAEECRFQETLNGFHPCDFCGLPFAKGELPDIDHDHLCCPQENHCLKCLRGFVHRECNTRAIMWMEWYEQTSGVTLDLLREYRERAVMRALHQRRG